MNIPVIMTDFLQLKTLFSRILYLCITGISLGFIFFNSLVSTGSKEYLWIETEQAKEITKGLDIIEDPKASNGQAIVSRLRSHQVEAYASYNFNINRPGKYIFWARAYWPGGCSNSYRIKLDNFPEYKIGNDNFLNAWHWISLKEQFNLKKGKHKLKIWNEEHLAQLDKIFLTSDPYYIPSGFGEGGDFTIDFKNGFPDFAVVNNKECFELQGEDEIQLYAKPVQEKEKSSIIFSNSNTENFAFEFYAKQGNQKENHSLTILFNYVDEKNLYKIILEDHSIQLLQVKNGQPEILKETNNPGIILDSLFAKYALVRIDPEITLKLNDIDIFKTKLNHPVNGKTGLLFTTGDLYLKNIRNTSEVFPLYTENFFYAGLNKLTSDDAHLKWEIISGDWTWVKNKDIMSVEGKAEKNKSGVIIFGKSYWKNYFLEAAIQLNSGEAGVCFYYQNPDNYYLLKLMLETKKLKLLSVKNNNEEVIGEMNYPFSRYDWYKVKVARFGRRITVTLNDEAQIEANDSLFLDGKAGLWSNGQNCSNLFDDISIAGPEPDPAKYRSNIHEYKFEMREHAGLDFCDWAKSGTSFRGRDLSGSFLGFTKNILEQKTIKNKKTFYGNTKLDWHLSNLPRDINIVSEFYSWHNGHQTDYKFSISTNKITVQKDKKRVYAVPFPNIPRNNLEITQIDGYWTVRNKEELLFRFNGEPIDSTRLAFGFSGIGRGAIVIHNLTIEEHIDHAHENIRNN